MLDAQRFATQLRDFTNGRHVRDLETDLVLNLAIERLMENVGEALRRVRDVQPEVAERFPEISEWIAQRNIIAHLYDDIDRDIIWDSASVRSLRLLEVLDTLLDDG